MRILRAAAHRIMPWKNGGGVTTEIAVFPEGAALDTFEWRLSMATVSVDGPFSLFPGIDRTLAVLEGEGILLSVEGLPDTAVTRNSAPLPFAADQPTSARLISGLTVDLNVMTRRGVWTHSLERLSPGNSGSVDQAGATSIVFCAAGAITVTSDAMPATLAPHDAAILDGPFDLAVHNNADVYLVTLLNAMR